MKDLETFWDRPAYLPYVQPELTDEMLKQAEAKFGCTLPPTLIELLKIQNGGYIRKTHEDSVNDKIYGIGPYFPSMLDINWDDLSDWVSFPLEGLIPFDGDGHWFICLDYRNHQETPVVTYVDIETDEHFEVAPSFDDYLSMLRARTENILVYISDQPIEAVINVFEDALNIKFEEPDTWAQGYPIYHSNIKNDHIWISANKVPKGFIRSDEDRYEELLPLTRGNALRYPEISEHAYLIQFSEEATTIEMTAFLGKKSISVVPLEDFL